MIDYISLLPDLAPRGRPLATLANVAEVCRRVGVQVRLNTYSHRGELVFPGEAPMDISRNTTVARVVDICAQFGVPNASLRKYLGVLAERNPYTPTAEEAFPADDKLWLHVRTRYLWDDQRPQWRWRTASQALVEAGWIPTPSDLKRAGKMFRQLNGYRHRMDAGKRLILVPPPRP